MRRRRIFANVFRFLLSGNRSVSLGLVALLLACGGMPVYLLAQQRAVIPQTPRAVREGSAQLIAHYDSNQMLRVAFALKPPHLQEEEQLLRQLQDKNSPQFHKYLSEKEWNERFAPSAEDEQAVVEWAQTQGLTITQRYPNRLLVDVEAPAGVIEKAMIVTINRYQIGNASYFSNDRDPAIPAALTGVVHAVLGLNNVEVMHSASRKTPELAHPDYSPGPVYAVGTHLRGDGDQSKLDAVLGRGKGAISPKYSYGAYDPTDIYNSTAYNYQALQNLGHCCNPLNDPNGSPPEASIAIAIWDDFSDSDLAAFLTNYSYLAHNVQRYSIDGGPPCCYPEVTMDVEWATAMANSFGSSSNTAQIHVYEGANGSVLTLMDVVNQALTDGHARVLSMSWGAAELYGNDAYTMDAFHAVFDQMVGQGWTLIAASGDRGTTTDCADHLSVSYPGSDPDVVSAGGTQLSAGPNYYNFEYAWSGGPAYCVNNDGGSGGGCSAYWAAPPYQSSPACGASSRSVPDIALNADWWYEPQNTFYNGSWSPNGGTSIVAPELAGFFAQENAYLLYLQSLVGDTCGSSLAAPCSPMGNANYYLYDEGLNQHAAHYPFYDITSGCNSNDITQKYGLTPFCAAAGYDLVTGWGSANMLQLAWSINDSLAGDGGGPSISFTGPLLNHWYNTDQTINWTVADTSSSGHPPNGVAGYTAFWDLDPGDPYREPTPGVSFPWSWNSFYSGPQVPNATTGSVDLSSAAGFGASCHTLNVRAWDNAGQPSSNSTYGPVCSDTIAPTTSSTLTGIQQGQDYVGPVLLTLTAYDYGYPGYGSGVASTVHQVNGGAWRGYTGPFYFVVPGTYNVSFYSKDHAGNVEATNRINFTIASNQQYQIWVDKVGTGSGSVNSSDGNLNCGTVCTHIYWNGSELTLTATPAPGSVFAGWSGCDQSFGFSCTLLVNQPRTATAIFNVPVALQFVPVTPCRVVDTRTQHGGGGPIQGGTAQSFNLPQLAQAKGCSDLSSAAVYSLNTTVIPYGTLGYLTVWPDGLTRPQTSALNSPDGRVKANAAIVPGGTGGAVDVYATDTTDVVMDIDGYFAPTSSSTLQFYPLTPCRVADTRQAGFPMGLGTPHLSAGTPRDFPILAGNCAIPSTAQAYSLNFTAIPSPGLGYPLGYLELWPKDQMPQNPVSTLNNVTGTIVANAAIVPAGTHGQITAYASNDTELVIDVNGYFAPGPGGMSLYSAAPCRAIDTRKVGTGQPFSGELSPIGVANGPCAPSAQAQAYVFNTTVVPTGSLGYLTLWPDGEGQPVVSTLNALDGTVTNNMAIVPTNNGSIDAYANGITQLVLDISSYFAP
jgi:kumamolisin